MANLNVAAIDRSLSTVHNELEFLKASGVLSSQAFEQISNQIPRTYHPDSNQLSQTPEVTISPPMQEKQQYNAPPQYSTAMSSGQPEMVEALYDYRPSDSSDLPLYRGAQIIVIEKINPDWWRGRDKNTNAEGIFPSSYVKTVEGFPSRAPSPYTPQQQQQQYQQYQQPQQQYQPQQYIAPTPQPYYPPPSPQPQDQGQGSQQHQHNGQQHHSGLERAGKKFGKKLGNAAIFGAGATIGSNIVNSIF
ncbi:SH3 domain-containing protein [Lipomyces arxii]|uniref:SH3 domain-containing protein n=1 Tax=Lipomyces arxii TaxID=56418 RepID=UPI0034CF7A4C